VPNVEGSDAGSSIDEDFEKLLADRTPEVAATARALRTAVREALPDAVQQVDFPDGLLAIGTGTKLRDQLFAIVPHTAHVNLQLVDGVDLPNPASIIEGTGKRIRHVKVLSAEMAESTAVRLVIDAQVQFRRPT
jgi:hypothetical protein